ncbi:MAG: PQQ-dependent sugar dehydrogenase [Campylobacterota bacterium]
MNKILSIFFGVFLSLLSANSLNLTYEKITTIDEKPWGMDFVSEDKLLITAKDGNIYLYDFKSDSIKNIYQVKDVLSHGQGGLLDIKVLKKDKKTWVYFTYSKSINNKGATTLARALYKNEKLFSQQDLFISKSISSRNIHYGSRIAFDESGHVFFTIGDRGNRDNAQNLKNHAGSVIRLNLDGTIPQDNPFVKNSEALNAIYSYGHRNPQGIFYDKQTKKLWSIEHGPRGGDEINLVKKGLNYGWPVISYGKEYWAPIQVGESTHKEGMQQPKKEFTPSIAPSSLILYKGNKFKGLKNRFLAGALKLKHINITTLKGDKIVGEIRVFKSLNQRIRNVIQSKDGNLYFSTDKGHIYTVK